ncbi:hypothetical protein ACWGMA_49280, partial [Streptomyces asiaticus]
MTAAPGREGGQCGAERLFGIDAERTEIPTLDRVPERRVHHARRRLLSGRLQPEPLTLEGIRRQIDPPSTRE